MRLVHLVVLCAVLIGDALARRPNIVFLLTDDQDTLLGSMQALPAVQTLLGDAGTQVDYAFANTPVCCPSRSSFMTGMYQHNTHVVNNSAPGNCSSAEWQNGPETLNVATYMKAAGYQTAYLGKYLNMYGYNEQGGQNVTHVPPGWDYWQALVGNSVYYNYTLSNNGVAEQHNASYEFDYLTDLVANRSIEFLQKVTAEHEPFFLWMSPPACHQPADPAPQYAYAFNGTRAPRTPSWNIKNPNRHWFAADSGVYGPMNETVTAFSDLLYERRLSTLLSVNDLLERVVALLEDADELDNTYIFFTSDHGYHLGQFGLAMDKRTNYEFDLRMPFFARGPGIPAGVVIPNAFVMAIDMAPTFLHIAGVTIPDQMDGQSLLPLLSPEVFADEEAMGTPHTQRQQLLVEYHGETNLATMLLPCVNDTFLTNMNCYRNGPLFTPPYYPYEPFCNCQDSTNQTYNCLRIFNSTTNVVYCSFISGEEEYFDVNTDPWQLNNLAAQLAPAVKAELVASMNALIACRGKECHVGRVSAAGTRERGTTFMRISDE